MMTSTGLAFFVVGSVISLVCFGIGAVAERRRIDWARRTQLKKILQDCEELLTENKNLSKQIAETKLQNNELERLLAAAHTAIYSTKCNY